MIQKVKFTIWKNKEKQNRSSKGKRPVFCDFCGEKIEKNEVFWLRKEYEKKEGWITKEPDKKGHESCVQSHSRPNMNEISMNNVSSKNREDFAEYLFGLGISHQDANETSYILEKREGAQHILSRSWKFYGKSWAKESLESLVEYMSQTGLPKDSLEEILEMPCFYVLKSGNVLGWRYPSKISKK